MLFLFILCFITLANENIMKLLEINFLGQLLTFIISLILFHLRSDLPVIKTSIQIANNPSMISHRIAIGVSALYFNLIKLFLFYLLLLFRNKL